MNANDMPADVLQKLTDAAARFGLDMDDIDNTDCPYE